MRALISEDSYKAVLFERAPDMCLKWDLYVNGVISVELKADIEVETRAYFDDEVPGHLLREQTVARYPATVASQQF